MCFNTASLNLLLQLLTIAKCALTTVSSSYTDINECAASPSPCEHRCINNPGSYECSCNIGYELHNDQENCFGMHVCSVLCHLFHSVESIICRQLLNLTLWA